MTKAEIIERKIFLKKQFIELTHREVEALEVMLHQERASEREGCNDTDAGRCAG